MGTEGCASRNIQRHSDFSLFRVCTSMAYADCQMTTRIYLRSTKANKKMLPILKKAKSKKNMIVTIFWALPSSLLFKSKNVVVWLWKHWPVRVSGCVYARVCVSPWLSSGKRRTGRREEVNLAGHPPHIKPKYPLYLSLDSKQHVLCFLWPINLQTVSISIYSPKDQFTLGGGGY